MEPLALFGSAPFTKKHDAYIKTPFSLLNYRIASNLVFIILRNLKKNKL